jgi:methyltransferase (TIGR00027 family)
LAGELAEEATVTTAPRRRPLVRRELHTTERPSSTAQWTTLSRALELARDDRIVTDVYAPVFLSRSSRGVLRSLDAAGGAVRRAERFELAGLAASALCRHRFIDEHLVAALPEVEQVLILGAGYDSRAYRFAREIGDRPVYEVDLAPLSRRKAAVVAAHPELFGPASIRRIEIDFHTQSLQSQLDGSDFVAGAATFVVWEGVSMYLTRDAVDATLAALASVCGAGSVLAMDYWQTVAGPGGYRLRRVIERGMALIGEPIRFAIDAASVSSVLEPPGFEVDDLAEAAEMTRRYATGGRRCDPGMYVVAARLA